MSRLQRISLEQYDSLLTGLLSTPSGGRFPVLVVVATLVTLKELFTLDWSIEWQGINVADTASGVGGDVTISKDRQIILAAEVTERHVDRSRVVATFSTKIAPASIGDYIFFTTTAGYAPEAADLARQYFAQGHEVNFIEIKNWILIMLATLGSKGRDIFHSKLLDLLDAPDVPKAMKVGWNDQIDKLTGSRA